MKLHALHEQQTGQRSRSRISSLLCATTPRNLVVSKNCWYYKRSFKTRSGYLIVAKVSQRKKVKMKNKTKLVKTNMNECYEMIFFLQIKVNLSNPVHASPLFSLHGLVSANKAVPIHNCPAQKQVPHVLGELDVAVDNKLECFQE